MTPMTQASTHTRLPRTIGLPRPLRDRHDTSLITALQRRCTTRQISPAPLSTQTLSDLLWAACGVNRGDGPFGTTRRTAASASNSQEIDICVATREGAYLYKAADHVPAPVATGDFRSGAMAPGQRGVHADVPVQLIYVADVRRLAHATGFQEPGLHDPEIQKSYYHVDTGMIAGNVYLFCAAAGLAAWFHNCDRTGLSLQLGLREDQRVLFAQSIGYPGISGEEERP